VRERERREEPVNSVTVVKIAEGAGAAEFIPTEP
jgi:hypothetical protein